MTNCTAREYLASGNRRFMVCSVPQMGTALLAEEYGASAWLWTRFEDHLRARDLARVAASYALLAFPDLREPRQIEVAA